MRADNGSSDLTGVGSEVAVQNVVGVIYVTRADVVVDTRSSSVWTGSRVTAKETAVWTNSKMVSHFMLSLVKVVGGERGGWENGQGPGIRGNISTGTPSGAVKL